MYEVNIQTRSVLIVPRNQQRHSEWSTHDALLALGTLSKPQRQIAYRLCTALDPKGLRVVESVVLALHARVLDHAAGIGLQTGHGAADVAIDFDNLLDR